MEEINALALLKDELETDQVGRVWASLQVNLKVNAIHRLKTVILAMQSQPESIGQKLIPFIECRTPPLSPSPHRNRGGLSALRHR